MNDNAALLSRKKNDGVFVTDRHVLCILELHADELECINRAAEFTGYSVPDFVRLAAYLSAQGALGGYAQLVTPRLPAQHSSQDAAAPRLRQA